MAVAIGIHEVNSSGVAADDGYELEYQDALQELRIVDAFYVAKRWEKNRWQLGESLRGDAARLNRQASG